jgi:hypothetical protein
MGKKSFHTSGKPPERYLYYGCRAKIRFSLRLAIAENKGMF